MNIFCDVAQKQPGQLITASVLGNIIQVMLIQNIEEIENSGQNSLFRESSYGRIVPKRLSQSTVIPNTSRMNIADEPRQCRICLDSVQTDDNQLVTPCKCIGSVRFIHDKCYRKWIQRQYSIKDQKQRQELIQNGIECQICKDRVMLVFRNRYLLCMKTKFISKFMNNPAVFIFFLIFLIINLGCIGYTAYSATNNPIVFKGNDLVTSIVIVSAISVLSITAVVTVFYFFSEYCVQKVWILDSYSIKQEKRSIRDEPTRFQIHPQELY